MIKQKTNVNFPDQSYQHFVGIKTSPQRNILSFSRSLKTLRWLEDKTRFGSKQKVDQNVKLIIHKKANVIQKQVYSKDNSTSSFKMSKDLSKLYDCYPVCLKKDQKKIDYLPFIPNEIFENPIRIDPKFSSIYLSKPSERLPNIDQFGQKVNVKKGTSKYNDYQMPINKEDLKYLNTDESSQMPFTTLKDYLNSQNQIPLQQTYTNNDQDL